MSTATHPGFRPRWSSRPAVWRDGPIGALRRAGVFLGTLLLFVVALVVGVSVHLDTRAARRVAVGEVDAMLASTLRGRIVVERLSGLDLFGVSGADATIYDADGRPVLVARGVDARFATFALLRSLLLDRHGPLVVDLPSVEVASVDVGLDEDRQGKLALAGAFAPRHPSPETPAERPGRGLRLVVGRLALGHGHAHRAAPPGGTAIDADLDGVRGDLLFEPDLLRADLDRASVTARAIAAGADVSGALAAHLNAASPAALGRTDASLSWDGRVGAVANSVRATLAAGKVDAVVDVPEATPEAVRSVWVDAPLDGPASFHAEARGTLPRVDLSLHAGLARALVEGRGHVLVEDTGRSASLALSARDVDVHEIARSAPRSRLGLDAEVSALQREDGTLAGTLHASFLGGPIGGTRAPAAEVRADASRDAASRLRADAQLVVREPGAPLQLTAQLRPGRSAPVVTFQVDGASGDLAAVPPLRRRAAGRVQLVGAGEADLGARRVEAELHARAESVGLEDASVQKVSLDARARGPLDSPMVDVDVRAAGVTAAGRRFSSLTLGVQGRARNPTVTVVVRSPDVPDVDATARVALEGGTSLRDLHAVLRGGGERAIVTTRELRFAPSLRVDEARVVGLGQPLTADVLAERGHLRVRASTPGLDVARLARLVGLAKALHRGRIALDADAEVGSRSGSGHVRLDVADASAGSVDGLGAHLELVLDRRRLTGKLHAQATGIGAVDVSAPRLDLPGRGSLFDEAPWRDAWGFVQVDGRVDLAHLLEVFPPDRQPLGEARGLVTVKAHYGRDDADDVTPDFALQLRTDRLMLAPATPLVRDIDGVLVHAPPRWRLFGVDLDVDATVDGASGKLTLNTTARDDHGALARLDATAAALPWGDALHDSARLLEHLRTAPIDVHLSVPERPLGRMPAMLRQHAVGGRLAADLRARGTMLAPNVDLGATLHHASFGGEGLARPLDLALTATYDGERARADVRARDTSREVLAVNAEVQARVAQLLQAGGAPAWRASARAHFDGFPLESVAALEDRRVAGPLVGDLELTGLHQDARVTGALRVAPLTVGSFTYRSADVTLRGGTGALDASVRVDQDDGFLQAQAQAVGVWGAEPAPRLDDTRPLRATVASKNFRIGVLLPFVDSVFDELDGRIDADTRVELDPRSRTARLAGTVALQRGAFEASAGGGEFHDVAALVRFTPDGTIRLEKLTAAGSTGSLDANGEAHLRGTKLESARAALDIPTSSPLDVSVEGMEVGRIGGHVDVTEKTSADGSAMDVEVHVPNMAVAVPEASTAKAQSLGPMPGVRIGAHRGRPLHFVLVPLDPVKKEEPPSSQPGTHLVLRTQLDEVRVTRGKDITVDLGGHVSVQPSAPAPVQGQIVLKHGGTVTLQGKKFTVENGTVTFVGPDTSDPEVVLRASYHAPDGTTVFATFTGPLKTGKVTLSSDPPLTQQEIVQVLLFGTAEGPQAQTPQASTANNAVGLVGGQAAQPINHALEQLGLGGVSARVDTTQAANPKPEVEVQIARDISVQLAVVLGQPPPGVNPDRTLLTLDWRFMSKWSLATTVGDAGTTIFDVLWRRRY